MLRKWSRDLFGKGKNGEARGRLGRHRAALPLRLEVLEDRTLLSAALVGHYDASSLSGFSDGQAVSTWQDASGHHDDLVHNGTASLPGTYVSDGIGGRPAIDFFWGSGGMSKGSYSSQDSLGSAFGIQGDAGWSYTIVLNYPATPADVGTDHFHPIGLGNGFVPLGAAVLEMENQRFDVATGFSNDLQLEPDNSAELLKNQNLIVTVTHAGGTGGSITSTTDLYINGAAPGEGILSGMSIVAAGSAATSPLALANDPFFVGGRGAAGAQGFRGQIAEVLVWNDALSPTERTTVESQLGQKYGITTASATTNSPPTADAGGPYYVNEGRSVVLNGSGSSDAEQTSGSLEYAWDLDGDGVFGETGSAAARGDEVGVSPTFNASGLTGPSSVTVALRVTDLGGLMSEATAVVNVRPVVKWDGGGGDSNWNNPLNWSTDRVPGPTDNVFLDASAPRTVVLDSGTSTINSLESQVELDVSGGASLTVANDMTLDPGSTLKASGTGTSVSVSGPARVDGANLFAVDGGVLNLPTATSYKAGNAPRTIRATGTGSRIDLSGVTTLAGSTGADCGACPKYQTVIQADGGGTIDLSAVQTMTLAASPTAIGAGSQVLLDSLTTFNGGRAAQISVSGGGLVYAPVLDQLTASVLASDGAVIDLSSVTSYSGGGIPQSIRATGTGSRIDLSGVTTLAGSTGADCGACPKFQTIIQADGGGTVDLSAVQTMTLAASPTAIGAGSQVLLDSLTTFNGGRAAQITVSGGGLVYAPVLDQLTASILASDGAVIDLSSVTSYSGGAIPQTIRATGTGSRIDLSGVTTFAGSVGADCGACPKFQTVIQADGGGTVDLAGVQTMTLAASPTAIGADSQVLLDSLTTFNGGRAAQITASGGGLVYAPVLDQLTASILASDGATIDLSSVTSYSGGGIPQSIRATGTGSLIDLSGVTTFAGSVGADCGACPKFQTVIQADGGGTIDLSAVQTMTLAASPTALGAGSQVLLNSLTTFNGGRAAQISVSGGGLVYAPVLDQLTASILASDGAVIDLSSVTSYSGGGIPQSIRATGTGSRIDLSGVTTLAGSTGADCGACPKFQTVIQADGGGTIDLSAVQTMTLAASPTALGAGSQVLLNSLTTFNGGRAAQISVSGGGLVYAPVLDQLTATILASDGAVIDLSSVTSYSGGDIPQSIRATGTGSRIDLSGVTTLAGSTGADCGACPKFLTVIQADNGGVAQLGAGVVDLSRRIAFIAEMGTLQAGTLHLTNLATALGTGALAADVVNEGLLQPGLGIGTLTIQGDFTQRETGALEIEMSGTTPGSQYDQLQVSGSADLCGKLVLLRGFTPAAGESFRVLTSATRSGEFDTVTGADLGNGTVLAPQYASDGVELKVVPNVPPTIGALSASPDSVSATGTLSVVASDVSDANGAVARVDFYLDANGDGILQPCSDHLLGTDDDGSDGWTVAAPLGGIEPGQYQVFARATDNDGLRSNVVSTQIDVVSATPLITFGGSGYDSTANSYSSTYNGQTQAASASVTGVGGANLGDASLSYYKGSYASLAALEEAILNNTAVLLSGPPTDAGSYTVLASYAGNTDYTPTSAIASFVISPAPIRYTIGNDTQAYGSPANLAADLPAAIATGVNNEALDISYASTGDTTTANVGSYAITGTLSNGTGLLSNYTVTLTNGTLTVNPYAFSYTIGNDSQAYGYPVNLAADLPPTIATGVNGETLDITYSSTGDTSTAAVGTYAITGVVSNGTGLVSNYAVTLTNGTLTVLGSGVTVVGTQLWIVGGTTTNDNVHIDPVGASATGSTGVKVDAVLNHVHTATTYHQSFTALYIFLYKGNDVIHLADTLTLNATIRAGNGNDNLHLDNGNNNVLLGDGNDNIRAGNGNNTITAGNGNDNVRLGDGNNTVTLGNGNDNVRVGDGDNVIVTGNGNDNIQAGNGDNLIVAGLGHHNVQVGDGSNILIDGSVQLTQSGDSLRQILDDWIAYGDAPSNVDSIRARLAVTYNDSYGNTLDAGSGLDWFWATDAQDSLNAKPTDLRN